MNNVTVSVSKKRMRKILKQIGCKSIAREKIKRLIIKERRRRIQKLRAKRIRRVKRK